MKYRTTYFQYKRFCQLLRTYINQSRFFIRKLKELISKADIAPTKYCVIPDKRIVYLINPKCACSSIKRAINELDESIHCPNIHVLPKVVQSYQNQLNSDEKNYFTFTFIRNPFERIVSFYINKFERDVQNQGRLFELRDYLGGVFNPHGTFAEMMQVLYGIPPHLCNRHFKPQSYLIDSADCSLDFIGRLENADTDWQTIAERFDLPPLSMVNQSPSYDYRDYYDLPTLELVNAYYQEDIQRFGYAESYEEIKAYLMAKQQGKLE